MYLVFSEFTSRPISLLASRTFDKSTVFLFHRKNTTDGQTVMDGLIRSSALTLESEEHLKDEQMGCLHFTSILHVSYKMQLKYVQKHRSRRGYKMFVLQMLNCNYLYFHYLLYYLSQCQIKMCVNRNLNCGE
jgi:hypothetical protein